MKKLINVSIKEDDFGGKTISVAIMIDGSLSILKKTQRELGLSFNDLLEEVTKPIKDVEKIYSLMSVKEAVEEALDNLEVLGEGLCLKNGIIYFGDEDFGSQEPLEETLSNHIINMVKEFRKEGIDFKTTDYWSSLTLFIDNLYQNVNKEVRESLYRWMNYEQGDGNDFAITDDGCLVGYKGCENVNGKILSVYEGEAYVNGEKITGRIPNEPNSIITMPRHKVENNPSVGCSEGLHVGTRAYAEDWAEVLIRVKVNPRDIVSVPFECDSQKMRVCEYKVIDVIDKEDKHELYHKVTQDDEIEYEEEIDLDEVFEVEEECSNCGCDDCAPCTLHEDCSTCEGSFCC